MTSEPRDCRWCGTSFVTEGQSRPNKLTCNAAPCVRATQRAKERTYRNNPPSLRRAWNQLKNQARTNTSQGRPARDLSLTYADFVKVRDPGVCYYCSGRIPLSSPGLDRVDSSRGYEVGNVVACCAVCNQRKAAMPQSVFLGMLVREAYYEADGSPGGEA